MQADQIQKLIDSMQDALVKAEDVLNDPDKDYPYAYGYLRGHNQHVIAILQAYLTLAQ